MDYSFYSTYPATTTVTSTEGLAAAIAALGAFAFVVILLAFAATVLTIIGQWKMFKKAGAEGYISLIPVYNVIKEMRLGGLPVYWFFLNYCALIPIIGFVGPLFLVFWKNIRLAKSFGKGAGTGVLLTFFPFVMYPVLGLGKAQYVGPQDDNQNA